MSAQAPRAVLMIRPRWFTPNALTAADNAFQRHPTADADTIATAAYDEVTRAAGQLEAAGITVHLFDDDATDRPDSVFPNNWFSTHSGGHLALYPMHAPNRRTERRTDIIEFLKQRYRVQDVIDYSGLEHDDLALEGTGAMVLDHEERVAYVARSRRADPVILERFCTNFGYEPIVFDAADSTGMPVYHTNVLMSIGERFALVQLSAITDPQRREDIARRLRADGRREVIDLTEEQVRAYAGNAIELAAGDSRVLALSTTAAASLSPSQRSVIERSSTVLALDVPTIEMAGGSVRCMLAGIHLSPRPA